MAIREIVRDGRKIGYDVQVSQRHPITRKKKFLRGKARTKWEAEALQAKLKKQLQDIIDGNVMPSWAALVSSYELNCLINKAESTRHNELSIIASHATPRFHSKLINQVTEGDIRDLLQGIDPERSLSLKHNIRKVISNVFNYAIERRYISENPCRRVKLEKIPEPALNILNDQQIRTFLQKAEQSGVEWFPVWAVAIYTGLRSGELIALRYKHLEHNEGKPIIRVQESWTKQGGYKPYTKNKQIRTIPINKELQRILDNLKSANANVAVLTISYFRKFRHGNRAMQQRIFAPFSKVAACQ